MNSVRYLYGHPSWAPLLSLREPHDRGAPTEGRPYRFIIFIVTATFPFLTDIQTAIIVYYPAGGSAGFAAAQCRAGPDLELSFLLS